MTSDELCKRASELFKATFADFEGCIFEVSQQGEPSLSLVFNHGKYDSDAIVACELAGNKPSGSSLLDRTRRRDINNTEGDRYYLTEDGKDVIKELLLPRQFNNGKPNWKQICGDFVDRTVVNMYGTQAPQYTKVSFISLNRLAGLLFGTHIDEDLKEYEVRIGAVMPQPMMGAMQMQAKYMLQIMCASTKEVNEMYKKCGWATTGSNIVR